MLLHKVCFRKLKSNLLKVKLLSSISLKLKENIQKYDFRDPGKYSLKEFPITQDTDDDVLVWDLVSRFLTRSEIVRFENESSLNSGFYCHL